MRRRFCGRADGSSPARRFRKPDLTKVNYEKNIDGGIVFRGSCRARGVLFELVRARMPARSSRVPRGAVRCVSVPSRQKCGGLPCRQSVPCGTGVSGGVSRCSAELPARKVARIESPPSRGLFFAAGGALSRIGGFGGLSARRNFRVFRRF